LGLFFYVQGKSPPAVNVPGTEERLYRHVREGKRQRKVRDLQSKTAELQNENLKLKRELWKLKKKEIRRRKDGSSPNLSPRKKIRELIEGKYVRV